MNKDVRELKDDALEKVNTRKSTSRMILTEKLEKFWTSDLCSKLFCTSSSRYDKQVTTTTTTTKNAIVGVTCDPIGNQMVYPTTSLWREHLSSFKIVFFFFNSQGSPACKVDCLWGFVVWSVHNTKWRVSSEHYMAFKTALYILRKVQIFTSLIPFAVGVTVSSFTRYSP